jgi:hypothetical protein
MLISDDGYISIRSRYLKLSRLGIFQYHRRIPKCLESHYNGRTHIVRSFRTRDATKAALEAARMARADDDLWTTLGTLVQHRERDRFSGDTELSPLLGGPIAPEARQGSYGQKLVTA